MGETFFAALRRHADADPDRPSLTIGDATLTRAEFVASVQHLAEAFRERGVTEGTWVTIALPNCIEFVQSAWAAWLLGATPQPVSHRLPASERSAIIDLADPALLVGEAHGDFPSMTAEEVAAAAAAPVEPGPEGGMAPEWKVLTSGGSTGRPKLIVAAAPADAEVVKPLGLLLYVRPDECVVNPGPMSHNAPFVVMTVGLLLGNHMVVTPRFDAAQTLELVQRHRADFLYLVPTMMLRIWRLENRADYDVSSLRVMFHMAAPCPPWLKQEWIDWLGGEKILELYGGTELQALTIITGTEWVEHRGSVGKAVIGEIVERDGELWMRRGAGEPNAYRYVGATAKSDGEGWESLGDLGYLDEDGYVYISDRDTDMILVGGENVYPAEVEAAIEEHPAVRSSCVIGLPHEDLGSVPHAIIQLASPVTDEELDAHLHERLVRYKLPRTFERSDEPLRDDAGKVRRSALRAARI
ncbi:MAG: bile acid-coenzyme ligase [Solirubrobacteraceae bacterium]|jgi:bile acid-coenzyme A ligase|nr:bile acid-coenzyme ligase [Solirubrobacteraceae bacterium]